MNVLQQEERPATTAAQTAADIDLRQAPRHYCANVRITRVLAKPTFHCLIAYVRDISIKGVCLRSFEPVPPGSRVAIDWNFDDPRRHRNVLARVVHSSLQADQLWSLGCEFEAPLTEAEVQALLGPARP